MNMNQWALSPEEAAILGVSAGEGLYNTTPDQIKTAQADRERLISQNEFARQQALSQLAGLDKSNGLQKELMYQNAGKAGTQSLQDSLDTEAFRNQLNEAQDLFDQSAESTNIVGSGQKKVSRGNWSGKRTQTYGAQIEGNVKNLLNEAGYDIDTMKPEVRESILKNKEALAAMFANRGTPLTNEQGMEITPNNAQALSDYLGATNTTKDTSQNAWEEGGVKTGAGAAAGASIGGAFGGVWAPVGAVIGGALGSVVGQNSTLSNIVGNMGGGRMSDSAMRSYGSAIAKQNALEDFKKKYTNYLQGQGFENRANVVNSSETNARTQALRDLLSRKG